MTKFVCVFSPIYQEQTRTPTVHLHEQFVTDLNASKLRMTVPDVAVVVVTALDASGALGRGFVPGILLPPVTAVARAGIRIVVPNRSVQAACASHDSTQVLWIRAVSLGQHVLGFRAIVLTAILRLVREDGDVVPGSRMPIGIIISLLKRPKPSEFA